MAAARGARRTLEPQAGRLSPVDAAQAEADAPDGAVEVLLDGIPVRLLPSGQWRSSALRALNEGNFDVWAEKVLADDESRKTWLDIDPTMDQVERFLENWRAATGQDRGESRASRRSSTSTVRR